MVLTAPLLLATCVGCSTSPAQTAQLPATLPQPQTTSSLNVAAQKLTPTKMSQVVTPDAPIAVEWSERAREFSPGTVLKSGSRGVVVARLQARLARLGYAVGEIDGIFGPQTQATVMQFQQAYGLLPDGVVEASIWEKLNRDITDSGQIKSSPPRQPIAQVAPPAPPSPTASVTAPIPLAAPSAKADAQSTQKTGWIVVLVVLQGAGWLVILQQLNKELVLFTGRSLVPGTSKQWLFSVRQ